MLRTFHPRISSSVLTKTAVSIGTAVFLLVSLLLPQFPAAAASTLTLTKTATLNNNVVAPNGRADEGDTIKYTFSVKNTGTVTLTNISVTDPLLPNLSCTIATLASGVTKNCTATNNVYILTQDNIDSGSVINIATATGKDPSGNPVSATDSKTVTLAGVPSLVLTKTASLDKTVVAPTSRADAGDQINYTITITNTGNLTLNNVTVDDTLMHSALSCDKFLPASLAPGAVMTCSPTYTLSQSDIDRGSVYNSATVSGNDPDGNIVSATDSKTVTLPQVAKLALTKTATLDKTVVAPTSRADTGDQIDYTLTITNTGNLTLNNVTVDDTLMHSALSCDKFLPASLAPDAVMTCSPTYTLNQSDIDRGSVYNSATVSGNDPGGNIVSATDSKTVTVAGVPSLVLTKTASLDKTVVPPTGRSDAGDKINYSLSVKNTGNLTLTNINLNDSLISLSDLSCDQTLPASLAPGAMITCTPIYTLQQSDIDKGSVDNTATASGKDPGDNPVNATDSKTVTLVGVPSLVLTKTATLDKTVVPPDGRSDPGDTITYAFSVKNTGNVTLTGINMTDPLLTNLVCKIDTLAPGDSSSCTATGNVYYLTQQDIDSGSIKNTATATSKLPGGGVGPTDTDSATVNFPGVPSLVLTKTATLDKAVVAPDGRSDPGDTITYTFSIKNTGNVTLTGINVTDSLLTSLVCKIDTLAPGDNGSCTATGNVYYLTQQDIDSGSVKNTATATSKLPGEGVGPTDTDSATVNFPGVPSLVLTKTATLDKAVVAPDGRSDPGDTITYTFSVKNTGNVTLTDINATDPLLTSLVCKIDTLAPGDSGSCTATGNVYYLTQQDIDSGSVKNTATATGQDPKQEVVTDTDSATINFPGAPNLALLKQVGTSASGPWNSSATLSAPGTVYYQFTLNNTGNVTLSNPFAVDDPTLAGKSVTVSCPPTPATLAPKDSIVCTASYSVSQADIDTGGFTNTATASGLFGTSKITSKESDATVKVSQNPALTLVKTAKPTTYSKAGDVIDYSYLVTNSGNVTVVAPFTITDDKATDQSCPAAPAGLAPGDSITCSATYTIQQSDVDTGTGSVKNTAKAHGFFGSTAVDSNQDDQTVTTNQNPVLSLTKTDNLNPDIFNTLGQVVTFTLTATNTGNVSLHTVTVSDDPGLTDFNCTVNNLPITLPLSSLAPGASIICTGTHAITQPDLAAGKFIDTASAGSNEATPADVGDTITANSTDLAITKTDNSTTYTPGGSISYTIVVSNLGPSDATGVSIADTVPNTITVTNIQCESSGIADCGTNASSGNSVSFTGVAINAGASNYLIITVDGTVSSDATGNLVNTASVTPGAGQIDSDDTNNNSTDTDTQTPILTTSASGPVTLGGKLSNSVTVESNESAPTSDSLDIPLAGTPAIHVVKSSTTSIIDHVGQVVPYTFLVSNTGDQTLTGISVNDPNCTADPVYQSGDTNTDNQLQQSETWSYTCSYTVTQAEIEKGGELSNMVTVESNESTPARDSVDIPFAGTPAIQVVKSSTTSLITHAGQLVPYTFIVNNTGNQTLTGITVHDLNCIFPPVYLSGDTNSDNALQQDETWTFTCLHRVTKAEMDASGLIADTAHLSGGNGTLSGTITFDVFAPGDTSCTTLLTPAPAGATVTGAGDYTSGAFMATSTGDYLWIAYYSGDANNNPVSTGCNDPDETSTVNSENLKLTTTASGPATLGDDIMDIAHLSGGNGTLSGKITFDVFAPGDVTCAIPLKPAPAGATVNGTGDYTSGGFAAPAAGSYRWIAHYSGDASNDPASTSCNDPDETSAVTESTTGNGGNGGNGRTGGHGGNGGNAAKLPSNLPGTGFAPGQVTSLPSQSFQYANLGNLWLEIPRLGVKMSIVGVPQSGSGWDVSWLGSQAGWLNGTAFPSTAGDSVLTGHVYDAFGQPGPFVNINWLWYGDEIIIHASGVQYVYNVRQVLQVAPNAVSSVIKHEELPWVTLITCRGFDEASNSYKYRVAVKAVLVEER